MKKFELTNTNKKNVLSAQDDMDMIDMELERAKRAGIPVDDDLIQLCSDCRSRLAKLQKVYMETVSNKKVLSDEQLFRSNSTRVK